MKMAQPLLHQVPIQLQAGQRDAAPLEYWNSDYFSAGGENAGTDFANLNDANWRTQTKEQHNGFSHHQAMQMLGKENYMNNLYYNNNNMVAMMGKSLVPADANSGGNMQNYWPDTPSTAAPSSPISRGITVDSAAGGPFGNMNGGGFYGPNFDDSPMNGTNNAFLNNRSISWDDNVNTSMFSDNPFSNGQIMIQLVPNKDQLRQSMMSKESMASNKSGRSDGTKIYDEEHDFGLCDFYGKMFRMCKELGFDNENCQQQLAHKTGGGTFFHYAAKKNNKPLFDYLVLNLDETIIKQQVHVIDDFGKKAIDLANPKKKNSLFEEFSALMVSFPAEDIDFSNPANEQVFAKEWKYQLQKNPELRKKLEAAKKAQAQSKLDDGANSNDLLDEKSGMPSNVAGQEKVIKASDIMSPYEAEELVPAEYKKCFKMLNNQGWKALDNKWPNNGQTILHYAAKTGKEDLCHFLILHYGADPEQKCHHGHDAAWYAKSKKHRLLAKKLYFRFLKEVK